MLRESSNDRPKAVFAKTKINLSPAAAAADGVLSHIPAVSCHMSPPRPVTCHRRVLSHSPLVSCHISPPRSVTYPPCVMSQIHSTSCHLSPLRPVACPPPGFPVTCPPSLISLWNLLTFVGLLSFFGLLDLLCCHISPLTILWHSVC